MVHKTDDTERFYNTSLSAMECATKLAESKDLVRVLKRTSKFENCRYNQIVFIFNDSVDPLMKLVDLSVEEYDNVQ